MRWKKAGKKITRKATTKNLSPAERAARAKGASKKKKRGAKKKSDAAIVREPVVLTGSQRRYLRGIAHTLHPLIQVGHKGITAGLVTELAEALESHELVKIRLGRHAPEEIADTADALAQETGAALVQIIGHVILLYRPAAEVEDRKIEVPKARKGELAREREKANDEGDTEDLGDEDDADDTEDLGDEDETEDLGDDGDEDLGDDGDEDLDDDGDGDLEGDDSDADDLYDELDEDDDE